MSEEKKQQTTKTVKELRKQQIQNIVLAVVTLIALAALGLAWFVNNTRVSANGVQVTSAGSRFELASKKEADSADTRMELEKFFDLFSPAGVGVNGFGDSTSDKSLDLFLNSTSNFSNYKPEDQLEPGDYGKITLYLHPLVDDMKMCYLDIQMLAYKEILDNDGKVTGTTLLDSTGDGIGDNLLKGHVLLFQNQDSQTGQYSEWINNRLVVYPPASGDTAVVVKEGDTEPTGTTEYFIKNHYYEISFYWIWPKYFRNYAYLDKRQGDLFASTSNSDYVELMKDMNEDSSAKKYFFEPTDGGSATVMNKRPISNQIQSTMSNADFNLCTRYYNEGDQYLGESVKYVMLKTIANE